MEFGRIYLFNRFLSLNTFESQDFFYLVPILDRAFRHFSGTSQLSRRRSFSSLLRTPPRNDLQISKREVRTVSPAFERARMAFSFASASASGFGAVAPSSNVRIQTGSDLEEIQTEVSLHGYA